MKATVRRASGIGFHGGDIPALAVLVVAIFLCADVGAAAPISKSPEQRLPQAVEHETLAEYEARSKKEPAYATGVFNASVTNLPAHYRGNSFMTLYKAAVVVSPKGEFETTAEYEARSTKHVDGTYAIVLNVSDAPPYDADKETLSTSVRLGAAFIGSRSEGHVEGYSECYLVDFVFAGESQHPASNAFGASTIITSTMSDTRAILPTGPLSAGATFEFKLPRGEAQRIKPRLKLKILVIGSIGPQQEPVIDLGMTLGTGQNGSYATTATITDHSETFTAYYLLRMNIADLWVFDSETGIVLAKHSDPGVARDIALKLPLLAGAPGVKTTTDQTAKTKERTRDLLYRTTILDLQNQKLVAQAAMEANERALGVKK
jgi:hypothetical protein